MNVKDYLKKWNISDEDFASNCKISFGTVKRLKRGFTARQETAEKIEKGTGGALKVSDLRRHDKRVKD